MKLNQSFFLKLLSIFILTTFCFNANALLSYKYNWTKIKSENFIVIVDKEYEEYGKTVAFKAELAFEALKGFSKKHPKKTFIIVGAANRKSSITSLQLASKRRLETHKCLDAVCSINHQ